MNTNGACRIGANCKYNMPSSSKKKRLKMVEIITECCANISIIAEPVNDPRPAAEVTPWWIQCHRPPRTAKHLRPGTYYLD